MNIFMILFALLGGSASDKNFDPASMVVKQVIKGVYDEKRVQTLAIIEEKYAPDFVDKIRIVE
jgi:hypothetical protein